MLTTASRTRWTLVGETTDEVASDLGAQPRRTFRWERADGMKAEARLTAFAFEHAHSDGRTVYGIDSRVEAREYADVPWSAVDAGTSPAREEIDSEPVHFFWSDSADDATVDAREWIALQDPARFFPEYA